VERDEHRPALARQSRKTSIVAIWWAGSSPAMGSSARISGVSCASTRARRTRACSPPDSSVAMRSRNGRGRAGRARHRLPCGPGRGGQVRDAAERHQRLDRDRPGDLAALRHPGDGRARSRALRRRGAVRPRPAGARARRASAWSFRRRWGRSAPRFPMASTAKLTRSTTGQAPAYHRQVAHGQEAHAISLRVL
jgi:hypothetical protein